MVRWKRNLLILCIGQFFVMASMSSIVPFLPLYLQELGLTNAKEISFWAGLIFAANFLTAFIFSPIWGKLADKHGRKIMVIRSGIGMAITISLMGVVTSHIQLLFLRLLSGTISGFIPAGIALISTNTPKERMGYALGTLQAGAVAGSIIGPMFGGIMADSLGFQSIFIYTGLTVFIATILVWIFVKEKFEKEEVPVKSSHLQDFKKIIAVKPILAIFGVATIVQLALQGTLPLISVYVQELAPNAEKIAFLAGVTMAVMGLSNMLASPQLGKLSDKYGPSHILFFSVLGAAVFMLPQAFVFNLWQLIILRFLLGLCLGGMLPAINTLVRHYAPKGMESTTFGYSNSAIFLGNLIGPIIAGVIASNFGIRSIFVWAGILLILNAAWVKFAILTKSSSSVKKRKFFQKQHS